MSIAERRAGGVGGTLGRWWVFAGLFLAVGCGAACGHPEDCPEPCPRGMYCNYGACVPAHDGGDDAAQDDAGDAGDE